MNHHRHKSEGNLNNCKQVKWRLVRRSCNKESKEWEKCFSKIMQTSKQQITLVG